MSGTCICSHGSFIHYFNRQYLHSCTFFFSFFGVAIFLIFLSWHCIVFSFSNYYIVNYSPNCFVTIVHSPREGKAEMYKVL